MASLSISVISPSLRLDVFALRLDMSGVFVLPGKLCSVTSQG